MTVAMNQLPPVAQCCDIYIHYIAKSIGTPSNERFDYFSNFHEYKS